MTFERTLSIIKPDATANKHIGAILHRFEQHGFKIVAAKLTRLSSEQGATFYNVHRERPFFADLVKYMTSGPVLMSVLEAPNAVKAHRDLMGATDPKKADKGTIRKDFGESIERNAVHGSDSLDNARQEIEFFFSGLEIF